LHEKREEIEKQTNKFHETFHAEQSEDENIYLCYLKVQFTRDYTG